MGNDLNDLRKSGLALVSVGVLVVVLRGVLDVTQSVALAMSLAGTALVLFGAVMVWRASRAES